MLCTIVGGSNDNNIRSVNQLRLQTDEVNIPSLPINKCALFLFKCSMSIVKEENTDTENSSFKRMWLLVQWVGSFPEDAYDIINATDVVLDDYSPTLDSLRIGSAIMVRCGRTKSPAHIQQISDNTDTLIGELRRLQKLVLKEGSTNKIKSTPKIQSRKRKFVDENSDMKKSTSKGTQTDEVVDENIITKLIQENQKLKAELYESNKIINSMCKDLKNIVQGTQKKLRDKDNDTTYDLDDTDSSSNDVSRKSSNLSRRSSDSSRRSNDLSRSPSIDYPVIEMKDKVLIGTGKTPIPRSVYNQVNWLSFTAATRKLLMTVFSRQILASHSLTGKPSPAFIACDMPAKMKLDPVKVSDIVEIVSARCGVSESMVRGAITTKCADENKMFKKRLEKSRDKIECDE